jgi:glycosyltransferase involved in cell wall biosynthesis
MKLIYCIHSVCNPGGMERVLLNKVSYLVSQLDWEIIIITTDQKGRPPFYPFPAKIKMRDLDINYSDDNGKFVFVKIVGYLIRRWKHKKVLSTLLMHEQADIVVSLYPSESSFLPKIKDGSKKVLELHFCKFFRMQYGRNGMLGYIDRYRTKQDERIARQFDKFVVLTEEDKGYWREMHNIEVIPNAALLVGDMYSNVSRHRVIAVGRLDYQKGFDRLLKAWTIIAKQELYKDWILDIYGQGEWHDLLWQMIDEYGISDSAYIHKPTTYIRNEYINSSMLVMSSNYEGFPMVMIEAMSCGVPVVSFDYKSGPKDIIQHGMNGLLVHNGDINGLAEAMMKLMKDEEYRKILSANARKVTTTYSEKVVMDKWVGMFRSLVDK